MRARTVAVAAALILAGPVAGRARAQEQCESSSVIEFDMGSTNIDLTGQGDLNAAAGWALLEAGRFVMVIPNPGPTTAEARLASVRAAAVVQYLRLRDLGPVVVGVVPPDDVERYPVRYRSGVVVMSCVGVPPGLAPVIDAENPPYP